jgi:hypothetical protein
MKARLSSSTSARYVLVSQQRHSRLPTRRRANRFQGLPPRALVPHRRSTRVAGLALKPTSGGARSSRRERCVVVGRVLNLRSGQCGGTGSGCLSSLRLRRGPTWSGTAAARRDDPDAAQTPHLIRPRSIHWPGSARRGLHLLLSQALRLTASKVLSSTMDGTVVAIHSSRGRVSAWSGARPVVGNGFGAVEVDLADVASLCRMPLMLELPQIGHRPVGGDTPACGTVRGMKLRLPEGPSAPRVSSNVV